MSARKHSPAGLPKDKLALVHIAKKTLQMADEAYRALLMNEGGVSSSRDLTDAGFQAVMKRFQQLGFVSQRNSREPPAQAGSFGARDGMATPKQIETIRGMWARWHGADDERALNRWLEKRFGVSALRFADVVAGQKAIEGLKAMLSRKKGAAQAVAETNTQGE